MTKIAATFHAFKDVDKYARVVGLDEIEKNDFNLNISRYVETADAAEKVDCRDGDRDVFASWRGSEPRPRLDERYLKELGYDG